MLPFIWMLLVLTDPSHGQQPAALDISKGVDWLTRYGYMPRPDFLTSQLQTLQSLNNAIKSMQRFAGIPETGELDAKTLDMMKKPRCSLPDIIGTSEIMRRRRRRRKRYALADTVWKKKTITWRVVSYPMASDLDQGNIDRLLHEAFQVWSRVSPLEFQHRSGDVDILVDFGRSQHGDGYPFDGPGGTLAHAFFPGDHPLAGDTHFDEDEMWTYNTEKGTDLAAVAVHEFGHAIGLAHSSAGDSIMRPYYQGPIGEVQRYHLPLDDMQGIEQLYGRRTERPGDHPRDDPPFHPSIPEVPHPRPSTKPDQGSPDRCSAAFDAVANIRGEAFFFKDHYFWRMQRAGNLVSLNPAQIHNFWRGLPADLTKIDSVYERMTDNKIVFFIKAQYWVFTNTQVEQGYPQSIRDFELPVDSVDGAFIWPHNGKTYFFKGDEFWRYDEQRRRMDLGYPKKVGLWKGVPPDLDDIMSFNNGNTYFFKGGAYWMMRGGEIEVASRASTARDWMHCDVPPEPPQSPDPDPKGCSCIKGRSTGRALRPAALCLLAALLAHLGSTHLLSPNAFKRELDRALKDSGVRGFTHLEAVETKDIAT
ncbi:matrix metalloproteinase-25-like [Rhinoraja longicauda]